MRSLAVLGLLLALGASGVGAQGGRVLLDGTLVVFPGSASGLQCLALDSGTLIVDAQRTGDMGAGAYPVTLTVQPFVAAPPLLSVSVSDSPTSTSVPVTGGPVCYSLQHSQDWTNRPDSAPKGQMVALRLTWSPVH